MPAIVNCPKCDAQVSLPVGAHPVWQVRCPLCVKEFPLAEALDKAPPELIVVDRGEPVATALPPHPDQSDSAAEDVATLPDFELELDDSPAATEMESETTATAAAEGSTPLDVVGDYAAMVGLSNNGMRHSPRGSRRWIGRAAGVVGGGVVGLVLGYFTLLWLGGPERDFLQLGPRLPSFILPAEFDRAVAVAPPTRDDQAGGSSPAPAANGEGSRSRPGTIEPEPTPPGPTSAPSEAASPREQPEPPDTGQPWPRGQSAPNRPSTAELPSDEGHTMTPVRPAPWIVSQGPAFSVAEIDHALKAARRACDVLASNQLSNRGARPAMGMAYRELCDLAEVITYPEDGISAARILGSRGTAGELVLQLAQTRAKRGELALIADHWIDAPQRSRRGIVLAGRVEQVRHNGTTDLYVLQIALAGRRSVNVLSRLVPRMTRGDQAVVLGSLVDHPTAGLAALRNGDRVTVQAGVIRRVPDSPDGST